MRISCQLANRKHHTIIACQVTGRRLTVPGVASKARTVANYTFLRGDLLPDPERLARTCNLSDPLNHYPIWISK